MGNGSIHFLRAVKLCWMTRSQIYPTIEDLTMENDKIMAVFMHDLCNSITSIRSAMELYEGTHEGLPSDLKRTFQSIHEQTEKILKMSTDLQAGR
jgi:signal transduction histidine kinase